MILGTLTLAAVVSAIIALLITVLFDQKGGDQ